MKVKLFTHTDLDGVGCAVLAYLAFGKENVDVEYCGYDDIDEKVREFLLHNEITYDAIYITDISINEENAREINSWVARDKVHLFDHHATALWMNKYDWCEVKVEAERGNNETIKLSGTEMFYLYLIGEGPCLFISKLLIDKLYDNISRFVEIVRDYDTWRWKEVLPEEEGIICKRVNDLFYIYGRDTFIEWITEQILHNRPLFFPSFNDTDHALLEQKQKDIDIYIEQKNKQLVAFCNSFGRTYGCVFAERYFSELGNRLCEMHPRLDYVAMIDIGNGKVHYRSIRDDIDLGSEIAHSFGGGGHRKAAGSTFNNLGALLNMVNWLDEKAGDKL